MCIRYKTFGFFSPEMDFFFTGLGRPLNEPKSPSLQLVDVLLNNIMLCPTLPQQEHISVVLD